MFLHNAVLMVRNAGLNFRIFNNGKQLNIQDESGLWHSFYPSSETMVFNKFDDWSKKCSMREIKFTDEFINYYFMNPDNIQNLFTKEE